MIHKKFNQAVAQGDWETAAKIEAVIKSRHERRLQSQRAELENELLKAQIAKTQAEADKISKDKQLSIWTVLAAIVAPLIALATFVKSFFK